MAIASTISRPAEALISTRELRVEPIVVTENLWKLYHAGKVEVPALRGVNFKVQPGEFVTVMGPSGCGKSSLLYVIGGTTCHSRMGPGGRQRPGGHERRRAHQASAA